MSADRVIPVCHRRLTPTYRQLMADSTPSKRGHHLRSRAEIEAFVEQVGRTQRRLDPQGTLGGSLRSSREVCARRRANGTAGVSGS